MLVVVEHRNIHPLAQSFLDLEAFRRLDIFEVDAAKAGFQRRHDLDEALGILFINLDIDRIYAGELLEQDRLAFHHRLGCQRADIAQAQHGRAIGDDRH